MHQRQRRTKDLSLHEPKSIITECKKKCVFQTMRRWKKKLLFPDKCNKIGCRTSSKKIQILKVKNETNMIKRSTSEIKPKTHCVIGHNAFFRVGSSEHQYSTCNNHQFAWIKLFLRLKKCCTWWRLSLAAKFGQEDGTGNYDKSR